MGPTIQKFRWLRLNERNWCNFGYKFWEGWGEIVRFLGNTFRERYGLYLFLEAVPRWALKKLLKNVKLFFSVGNFGYIYIVVVVLQGLDLKGFERVDSNLPTVKMSAHTS